MSGILFDHEISTITSKRKSFNYLKAIRVTTKYSLRNNLWFRSILFYSFILLIEMTFIIFLFKNYQNDSQELIDLRNFLFGWFLWILFGESSRISLRVFKHTKNNNENSFIHQISYGSIIYTISISLIWTVFVCTFIILSFAILTSLSIFTIEFLPNVLILIILSLIFGIITNFIVLSIYLRYDNFKIDYISPFIFVITTFFSTTFVSLKDIESSMIETPFLLSVIELLNPLTVVLDISRTNPLSISELTEFNLFYLIFLIIILIPMSYYSLIRSYKYAKEHLGVIYFE